MENRIPETSTGSETCNETETRKVWINGTRLEKLDVNQTAGGSGGSSEVAGCSPS